MKKIILTFTILYSFIMTAQTHPQQPDFAFPKKVISEALSDYDTAVKNNDGDKIINSLVAYELATAAIDRDSVNKPIRLISETAKTSDAPTAAILNILLADIYYEIYNAARYKYDNRELPDDDMTDNFLMWSGDQFKLKINSLIDSSLIAPEKLQATRLNQYPKSIVADKRTLEFYPTVYDFVTHKAIQLTNGLSPVQHDFSINLLCRYDFYTKLSFNYQSPAAKRILKLYSDLLNFHQGAAAPFIQADIDRINFISRNVFNQDDNQNSETRRTELLYSLYHKFESSPYSGEALIALNQPEETDSTAIARYFNTLKKFSSEHPAYFRVNCIKNNIASITQPTVRLSFPRTIVPGDEMKISVTAFNTERYELLVYKVPYASYSAKVNASRTPIKRISRSFTEKAPFSRKCEESLTLSVPGTYAIVPAINGKPDFSGYYEVVQCTNLTAATGTYAGKTWAYITNPLTGEPQSKDVTITVVGNRGVVSGRLPVAHENLTLVDIKGHSLYATSGNDRSADSYILRSHPDAGKTTYSITAFTDLAIYHPGDTVQWSAVVQSISLKEGAKVVPAIEIEATLRTANYELIDTVKCMTDEFGRATGTFRLPSEGLTGYYSIQFRHISPDGKPSTYGSKNFMVSDYKLPTYKLEITDIRRDYPNKGDVTVDGKAESYSGFPIANCSVAVNLSGVKYSWWMPSVQRSFYSTDIKTDDHGKLSITFPAELLSSSPIEGNIYEIGMTATSPSGENQSAKKTFSLGKPYILNASIPADIDASKPVKFMAELTDLMSKKVEKPIEYIIVKDNDTIASGTINSNSTPINLDNVPSGTYDITFQPVDSSLAAPYTAQHINIYRPEDALPPLTETPIWLPENHITASSRKLSVLYGTRADICHIFYAVTTPDSLLHQGWLKVSPGMHRFQYDLPEGVDKATVTLSSIYDYKSSLHSIDITLEESIRDINLSIESFRDKIVPGENETWKFKVTDRSGNGTRAAIMLDMYCKALDELMPYSMQLHQQPAAGNFFRMSTPTAFGDMHSYYSLRGLKLLKCQELFPPAIQRWRQSYYLEEILNTVKTTSRMLFSDDSSVVREAKMMAMNDMKSEEAADYAAPAMGAGDADAGNSESKNEQDFQYRPAETPLAFFLPSLTTEKDGTMEFSFTAPNANTTWQLCALAFTKELSASTLSREIISSKPVMVQPNLPRFLRTGDKAVISAMVMNNSDTLQLIETVVEIFNPLNNAIIDRFSYCDTIPSGVSATINSEIIAPTDATMIGYRIKSSINNYADGEQSILPILPSIAPVIDSTPFYIPANESSFELKLPEIKKDANVTLQYCNNPVWYVVTALPGLRKDGAKDALSQSAAIFSAAIADGIIAKDSGIASAIKEWTANPKDSTLTSMLQRNNDLKIILLNATPWMIDAKNQTARMERLALLFDRSIIQSTYASAIKRLSVLECAGGGWTWAEQYEEPSEWITQNILANLGRLKQLGFGPNDASLDNMAARAVGYIDREAAKTLKYNPNASDLAYLLTRDYYMDIPVPSNVQRLVSNTLSSIRRDWKTYDIPNKAIAAIILFNHNEKAIARQIIESLREFSSSSPEKGMWWPSLDNMTSWSMGKISATSIVLDAFALIEPKSSAVDSIRQWLILQKEAKDWGTSVSTSDAIYSILSCGSSWIRESGIPSIKIGKKQISANDTDSRIGYLRSDISNLHPSKNNLTINSHDSIPSWGSIIVRYKSEISEIKAAGCDDVNVNKQLFKQVTDTAGIKWVPADSLTVGDVAQVNITITTKRDMDYVTIIDERGACFEPVEQLPSPIYSEGICFYRENRDASTNIFVNHLPKGIYRISYELNVNNAGHYSSGIATLQSQYAPALTAHSAGDILTVDQK